jgi:hypothetical protein
MAPLRTDKTTDTSPSVYLYKKSLQQQQQQQQQQQRSYRRLSRREDSINSVEFPLDDSHLQTAGECFF